MTLVEVVAGLALLGTILVAILLTRARHVRQAAVAQHRIEAAAVADDLLANWWQDAASFPRHGGGDIEDSLYLAWRTSLVRSDAAAELGANVVRLEMLDRQRQGDAAVLIAVDVVLPQVQRQP